MRFLRNASLGARGIAAAAAALIDDDTSGGTKSGQQPDTADGPGTQTGADGEGGEPQGETNTDADGTGDGSSNQPDDTGTGDQDGGDAGDQPSDQGGSGGDGDQHSEASLAAGRAQMHTRIETVFAADECKGREQAAATFLAADLPADKIIVALGKLPKGEAGDKMLARLAGDAALTPTIGAGAGETDAGKNTESVWATALDRLEPLPAK